MSTDQLIADAIALPLLERVSLAQALWESIDAGLPDADERVAVAERLPPWFIDVDQFVGVLRTAVERFLTDITADAPKLELISRRIRESYFSNGVLLGRPAR